MKGLNHCQGPALTGLRVPEQGCVDQKCQAEKNRHAEEKVKDTEESKKDNPMNTDFTCVYFPYALYIPIQKWGQTEGKRVFYHGTENRLITSSIPETLSNYILS